MHHAGDHRRLAELTGQMTDRRFPPPWTVTALHRGLPGHRRERPGACLFLSSGEGQRRAHRGRAHDGRGEAHGEQLAKLPVLLGKAKGTP
jgi:hypothetical protein